MSINIVLLEPEIPHNTGNIGRTCVVTGSPLHLIKPLGFSVSEKHLKRAGLDYWDQLDVSYYDSFNDFLLKNQNAKLYMATTKAENIYSDIIYEDGCFIVFGKESAGIPEEILLNYQDTSVRIPMLQQHRSLNLANSVSVILYEALRQQSFKGLLTAGRLHRYTWNK